MTETRTWAFSRGFLLNFGQFRLHEVPACRPRYFLEAGAITTTELMASAAPAMHPRPTCGRPVRRKAQDIQPSAGAAPTATRCPAQKSKGCRETEKQQMRRGG